MAKVFRCDRCKRFDSSNGEGGRPTTRAVYSKHQYTLNLRDVSDDSDEYSYKGEYELCGSCSSELTTFLTQVPPQSV